MKKKFTLWIFWVIILILLLLIISFFSLSIGTIKIPFKKIIPLIFKDKNITEYNILINIRLPRIILGFAIGGALSLSGVILQGLFRNPLVEPYTLGISGGASLGVCLNIIMKLYKINILTLPISGFLGAIFVILVVYSLSIKKGILKIHWLLLTGVMISFISSSLIMLIMSLSRVEELHGIIFWIMGSLEESNFFLIKLAVLVSIFGLITSYFFCFDLNAFSLGEEEALHLGINIERTKRILFILSSLLTGCSVSIAGIIGFVGLLIPHFVRIVVGIDHRIVLISSFLCGGIFLIICDTLARTIITPLELPVGVITGILGGVVFMYALYRKEH